MKKMTLQYRILMIIANIIVIGFLILPLVPVILGSIQLEKEIQANTTALLPDSYTLENFKLILFGGTDRELRLEHLSYLPENIKTFPNAFLNSVIVGIAVTVLTLILGSLTAYTIARLRLRWTSVLLQINLVSRMVPLIVLMVPLYVVLRNLGLLNSLSGIIITEVGLLLPYAIIILTPYFAAFPVSLEDAARLDGCTRFEAFLRIILPLSKPALAACGVIMFIISWHELLIPLIIVSKPQFMTVPVVLAGLVSDQFVFFTVMMAICLVGLLPTLLLVLLLQKYLVKGLVAGAVKG